jgi:hypothetical protein
MKGFLFLRFTLYVFFLSERQAGMNKFFLPTNPENSMPCLLARLRLGMKKEI